MAGKSGRDRELEVLSMFVNKTKPLIEGKKPEEAEPIISAQIQLLETNERGIIESHRNYVETLLMPEEYRRLMEEAIVKRLDKEGAARSKVLSQLRPEQIVKSGEFITPTKKKLEEWFEIHETPLEERKRIKEKLGPDLEQLAVNELNFWLNMEKILENLLKDGEISCNGMSF